MERDEIVESVELCMEVFFDDPKNPIKKAVLRKLYNVLLEELTKRFLLRSNAMFKAVNYSTGKIVGFAEIYHTHKNPIAETTDTEDSSGSDTTNDELCDIYEPCDYLPKYAKIANLAVSSSVRRKGVGKQLLQCCLLYASEKGFDNVSLAVDQDNVDALNFYSRSGFNEKGSEEKGWRYEWSGWRLKPVFIPKIIMNKKLSSVE
eukprot:CAMPEP_0182430422 /NCGR_PEP_ID=MMETSP1167-20130531/40418_1 /TAXON_ID=2988 /ORGANISM="Mallomonas Sp, Strain CCMP3275" /LENGTH=203 /DNA_ID=CAMNT_0024615497 /DNA_START=260 /DNA_END=871 /DNA_ORIENTATION=+